MGLGSFNIDKRCFWFDDEGAPVNGGCQNRVCRFAHPDEDRWYSLPKSNKRPFRERYIDHDDDRVHDRGWDDRRPPRHRRRRSSSPASTSRSRSPSHRRRERRSSDYPSESPTTRRMSVDKHQSERAYSPPPRSSTPTLSDRMRPPTQQNALNVAIRDSSRPKSIPPGTPMTPVYKPQTPTFAAHPPPPPAGPAPAMPPPCPLPEIPQGLNVESTRPAPEASVEEKRKLWEERTKLLADAVQSKQKLAEYEEQLKDAMDVVQSHFFNTLGADDKRRLNEELATLTTDCESAKQAVEDIMNKLVAHGSWPVAPPPETPMEQEMAKRHAEIIEYVQELHDTVSKMNGLLGDIAQLKKPPTLPGSSDEEDKPEDDGMPMEVDHASLPTRKRRRLSESVNDASSHTTMATASSSADLPSREELNSVLEQLVRFEGLAETVSNDMTQHAAELSLNFKTRVEDVVEELEANFIATQQQQNSQLTAQAEAREAEVRAVRAESESMGTQVGEMADEVSSLALKVEKLELDVETKRRERQESFERVLQIEQRLKSFQESRQTQERTIQTLEAALKAYKSRPPSPPASPMLPAPAYILEALEDPLIQAVRMSILPMMDEVRTDVENLVLQKNSQTISAIAPRIEFVSKVLVKISDKLDKESGQTAAGQQNTPVAGPNNAFAQ